MYRPRPAAPLLPDELRGRDIAAQQQRPTTDDDSGDSGAGNVLSSSPGTSSSSSLFSSMARFPQRSGQTAADMLRQNVADGLRGVVTSPSSAAPPWAAGRIGGAGRVMGHMPVLLTPRRLL